MTDLEITSGDTQTVPSGQLESGDPVTLAGELELSGTLVVTDDQPLRARGTATAEGTATLDILTPLIRESNRGVGWHETEERSVGWHEEAERTLNADSDQ